MQTTPTIFHKFIRALSFAFFDQKSWYEAVASSFTFPDAVDCSAPRTWHTPYPYKMYHAKRIDSHTLRPHSKQASPWPSNIPVVYQFKVTVTNLNAKTSKQPKTFKMSGKDILRTDYKL